MRPYGSDPFTHEDYFALPEGFPAELLDAMLVKEPTPEAWHQRIVLELAIRARAAVGAERVTIAPMDVVLDVENIFGPDVAVFPPGERIRRGREPKVLPRLVIEVLSPLTADRDRDEKAAIYLKNGIPEVWLVDPNRETIEVLTHEGATRFLAKDTARSAAVPEIAVSYRELIGGKST